MVELLMKVIGACTVVLMTMLMEGLFRRQAGEFDGKHQSVYLSDTDTYAIVTLKDMSNFIST